MYVINLNDTNRMENVIYLRCNIMYGISVQQQVVILHFRFDKHDRTTPQ